MWSLQFLLSLALLLLVQQTCAALSGELDPIRIATTTIPHLMARAAAPTTTQYTCEWKDVIVGTSTTPMYLVIGLSVGGLAGIVISIFTFYEAGKNSRRSGGQMPMM